MINKSKLKETVQIPMDDKDIKFYLPHGKIIIYSELSKVTDLDQILRKDEDYMIILYPVESPSNGHWTGVLKYKINDKTIYEYFDPYGNTVDEPLSWIRDKLYDFKIYRPYLSDLFDRSDKDVIYNPTDWQSDKNNINSCGRHVCFRIINYFKYNRDLKQYYNFMKKLKKDLKLPYDEIVSFMINK